MANQQTGMGRSWPDGAVVRSAQAGDVAAISVLVEGAHPHVRRFAASLCLSEQDAEDATQEALVILYRKIGTLRATGALASWMFTIVRNECVRRWSISRRHVLAEVTDLPLRPSSSAEEDALAGIEARLVAAAIAELPPGQRQVLLLRDVHGYSGRAVAKHLGLSVPAMKSRLHRARAALRAGLEDAA
ncbi:RNA polymerase sigma factor [Nocardioides sp. NPDC057767]|uniref:RNA polymerase sigma factor n=1 Tax=unclassified Nocardioides TaxID=2615069 RepID=UPI0036721185